MRGRYATKRTVRANPREGSLAAHKTVEDRPFRPRRIRGRRLLSLKAGLECRLAVLPQHPSRVLIVKRHSCLIVNDNSFSVLSAVASSLLRTADLATSDRRGCFLHVFFRPCAETDIDDNLKTPNL